MQIFEANNPKQFNDFLISQNASVLQSWQWGEFQKRIGRKVWRVLLSSNTGKDLAAATIVRMPLPRGKSYLYCPRGPVIAASPHLAKIWQLFLDKLSDLTVTEKPIFLRIDPSVESYSEGFRLEDIGFQKVAWEIQPKTTQCLNLKVSEADLLHAMKPKTRYNINLAQRKGVVVEHGNDGKKTKLFWELVKETVQRDSFSPHPYIYYLNLIEVLGKSGSAELILASYQNRPLAGAIVAFFGSSAIYLHGASSDRLRSAMAPYLVQWESILESKKRGCAIYDFGGTAPEGAVNHPWLGITRFKKGFGGQEVNFIGAYDLPLDKKWYWLYKVARGLNRII